MTIRDVRLTDKFHIWVAATNLMLEEVNREIVLEAKQQLKTIDKSTLVAAINELFDTKLNRDENIELTDNDIIVKTLLASTKIQVGKEGVGNPYIEFYDDTTNIYRKVLFNNETQSWQIENKDGELVDIMTSKSTFDGNEQTILLKRLPDEEFQTYTGPEGSLSYNLVTKEVRTHDGFTAGGISLLTHTLEIDKVKTTEDDAKPDYLVNKLIEGNGISIRSEQIDGNIKILISNTLHNEFDEIIPGTYIKRDLNGKTFKSLSNIQVINDLKLGQLHTKSTTFNAVILLEDDVYSYIKDVEDVTVMSFNTDILTYTEGALNFEVILNIKQLNEIRFTNNIKWNNGLEPTFDKLGTYILKFKSYNGGMLWFGNVEGVYTD